MAWQKKQNREIAIGAVRSEIRKQGFIAERQSARTALAVLNEIALRNPELRASSWYLNCTDNEICLFVRDWNTWAKKAMREAREPANTTCTGLATPRDTAILTQEMLILEVTGRAKRQPVT